MAFFRSGGVRNHAGGRRGRWLRLLALASAVLGGAAGFAFYAAFLTDLPDLQSIGDYRPPLTSRVLDRNGRLIGEFFSERRQLSSIDEIPKHLQLAFVSAEDSAFFEHSGIDYISILRAAWIDLTTGQKRQGASTITMQLVKQLLLSPEKSYRRKIREMILARRIENHFTKREILYLYLNHIYFGHGAHGVREAAYTFFDKDVANVTVAEAALLAGLPQRPTAYSPFRQPEAAEKRRRYVLRRMLEEGVIDQAQYDEARAHPPAIQSPAARETAKSAAYFSEEVRRVLFDQLGGERVLNGGLVVETTADLDLQVTATQAVHKGLIELDHRQGYRGPLRKVPRSEVMAEAARLADENQLAALEPAEPPNDAAPSSDAAAPSETPAPSEPEAQAEDATPPETAAPAQLEIPFDRALSGVVLEVDSRSQSAVVAVAPDLLGRVHLRDASWARPVNPERAPYNMTEISSVFAVGDVARFERLPDLPDDAQPRLALAQEPLVEGALLSIDLATGDVLALVGGYDFARSQFNRATQAQRQAGSSFKPFIYAAAISRGYTPTSIVYDRPVVYEDPVSGFTWRPQNYSREFYGPLTMRTALARSVNNATVHLFRDLGVAYVIDYARRLGVRSPLSPDLSLALGSSGLTLLELTSAYATFPNGGRRIAPRFIVRVRDRDGNVLLENALLGGPLPPPPPPLPELLPAAPIPEIAPEGGTPAAPADADAPPALPPDVSPDQIISPQSAFLMCDMLKAVITDPKGTGGRLRTLGRPVAGKTGTTNEQADAWFIGFSPELATGVWVGYDETRVLGFGETGARAALPIWQDFMTVALADRPVRDFEAPERITYRRVDRSTGLLADDSSSDAYFQPFLEGSEPTETAAHVSAASDTQRALREDSF